MRVLLACLICASVVSLAGCGDDPQPMRPEGAAGTYELDPEASEVLAIQQREAAAAEEIAALPAPEAEAVRAVLHNEVRTRLAGLRVRLTLSEDGAARYPGGQGTWEVQGGEVVVTGSDGAVVGRLELQENSLRGRFGNSPHDLVFARLD